MENNIKKDAYYSVEYIKYINKQTLNSRILVYCTLKVTRWAEECQ